MMTCQTLSFELAMDQYSTLSDTLNAINYGQIEFASALPPIQMHQ